MFNGPREINDPAGYIIIIIIEIQMQKEEEGNFFFSLYVICISWTTWKLSYRLESKQR